MNRSKQVIVVRKDLNMRKGKMCAQSAHASMKAILDRMTDTQTFTSPLQDEELTIKVLPLDPGSPIEDWINGLFTKVCVSVDSEAELLAIYEKAKSSGLICSLIQDAGLTEFGGVPTYTTVAIGPAWENDINPITGHLKLL